jgi:hypothetical protein
MERPADWSGEGATRVWEGGRCWVAGAEGMNMTPAAGAAAGGCAAGAPKT